MAKVATQSALGSSSLQIGANGLKVGSGPMVKRKTPSQLRGEQLNRTDVVEIVDETPASFGGLTNNNIIAGLRKPDLPKNPRYVETRVDEVYPAKKSRLRVLSTKENVKENISTEKTTRLKNVNMLSSLAAMKNITSLENSIAPSVVSKEDNMQSQKTIEKCSQSIFRSVAELSKNGEKPLGLAIVDMDKALKGLVAHEPSNFSASTGNFSKNFGNHASTHSSNFLSQCSVPGLKAPLDFTLKTKVWVASSCSVNWIHRSVMCSAYSGVPQLSSQFGCFEGGYGSWQELPFQILSSKALHSWIYPQSTLPPSVISVLSSQAAEGDFLRKRQLQWEDSFRSLYYMLRKNICNLFYVCTSHFVVMFLSSSGSRGVKHSCNAYVSQSTRSLRSLLREHDVCFSMPLCHSKEEQATTEDLVELSEIEKQNLGQTRLRTSLSDVDNTPESLLAFNGNKNVHALYDFLLNYRSSLTLLSGLDVPALYSPIPFQNAAISAPQIRCVEMKRVDHVATSSEESKTNDGDIQGSSSSGLCSSIEIKDAYIPLWIICRLCALIGCEGNTFEASFLTGHNSIGLNIALQTLCQQSVSEDVASKGVQETGNCCGITEASVAPCLSSGFLKGLKYIDGSYTATLSPI